MNTITIHTTIGTGEQRKNLHVFRVVPSIGVDFSKLAAVDKLIRSIHSGQMPPAMAEQRLDEIDRMPAPYKPSTVMLPDCGVSRRLRQRSRVDLPEPEGPIRQTTSPVSTSRSIPRSTSRSP